MDNEVEQTCCSLPRPLRGVLARRAPLRRWLLLVGERGSGGALDARGREAERCRMRVESYC